MQCYRSGMILFRIRIQLWIFRVPDLDPDPGKSSGSMQIRIRIQPILIKYLYFEIIQKHPLNSFKKKNLNNYLPFSIQYYCPIVKTVQNSQFYIYMLFHFLLDPDPELIIPDPDLGKSSGSDPIRIRNTVKKTIRARDLCEVPLDWCLPDPDPKQIITKPDLLWIVAATHAKI